MDGTAPHLHPDAGPPPALPDASARPTTRLWRPRRVVILPAAAETEVARRAARVGAEIGAKVVWAKADRLTGLTSDDPRETYRRAKSTLAIVRAPPSATRFQPIPPSADFRLDLATGCPAHCQYCYLAGSLSGPPVTRAYGNLDDLLAAVPSHLGRGRITSADAERAGEGTTFEASCYTDPLGIEHLTGGLARAIAWFGEEEAAGLRFTTKYDHVSPLLDLPHRGRTRIRFSVNAEQIVRRWEGGTAPLPARLAAMGRVARAGYPVGLTIAPIMPVEGWRDAYEALLRQAAAALPRDADLTVELITHRFTPGSRDVLTGWYPATTLEMDPEVRSQKRGKFGNVKYVYPAALMREMRGAFDEMLAHRLPAARVLYWT
jgi:spore photoproduct lyase